MKKCKCPYAHFNYMGHEEIEIVDCLVYNREIGEHYECYCNNKKESELYYGNCCLYKLQSKIDKATKKADELRKYIYRELVDFNVCGSTEAHCLAKDLLDILKEVG